LTHVYILTSPYLPSPSTTFVDELKTEERGEIDRGEIDE
jgi:hypothetical protein